MKVVIAEKPSVARELAKVLKANDKKDGYLEGNGYRVTWAIGHLISLSDPKDYGWEKWELQDLPMLPDEFTLKLSEDAGIKKQYKVIKELLSQAAEIIVATDAGREGELIFRYIYTHSGCKKPFKRLWISSQTEAAIIEGFNNLKAGTNYDNLYYAARARSEADWLVGMNATRALTLSAASQGALSIGRVQTPILAMICNRYVEHTNFSPQPFWELSITLEKDAILFKARHPKTFLTQQEADEAKDKLTSEATCTKAETKRVLEKAPLLFDLTSLQQETNKKFGFSAQQTLDLAQDLYEKYKLITYPRTGSRYLSEDIYKHIPELLASVASLGKFKRFADGLASAPISKKPIDSNKVTDHHAILPTEVCSESIDLPENHEMLYDLIVTRFLAAFSADCEKDITNLEFVSGILFKAIGSVIIFPGWRAVESQQQDEEIGAVEGVENENNQKLPKVTQGDELPVNNAAIIKKMSKPKPIHTEASLLRLMETAGKIIEDETLRETLKDIGIGTPATRAGIIETLFKREYIIRDKKKIVPTLKGLQVYELVKEKQIASAELTGNWEKQLNMIAQGKAKYSEFIYTIKEYTRAVVADLASSGIFIGSLPLCPKCKNTTLKDGGKAIGCKTENCGLTIWKTIGGKSLPEDAIKALLEGKETNVIKGFKGKDPQAKPFDAKLGFNGEWKIVYRFSQPQQTKIVCPKCKVANLIESEDLLKCISTPACDFVLWKKMFGKKLPAKIITQLLSGKVSEEVEGFYSEKTKKSFNAHLKMDENFKIALVFAGKKPEKKIADLAPMFTPVSILKRNQGILKIKLQNARELELQNMAF